MSIILVFISAARSTKHRNEKQMKEKRKKPTKSCQIDATQATHFLYSTTSAHILLLFRFDLLSSSDSNTRVHRCVHVLSHSTIWSNPTNRMIWWKCTNYLFWSNNICPTFFYLIFIFPLFNTHHFTLSPVVVFIAQRKNQCHYLKLNWWLIAIPIYPKCTNNIIIIEAKCTRFAPTQQQQQKRKRQKKIFCQFYTTNRRAADNLIKWLDFIRVNMCVWLFVNGVIFGHIQFDYNKIIIKNN